MESKNRGNFLELLNFLSCHNESIKIVFENASDNNKLTAPSIQKVITNACSILTSRAIISELGEEPFAILVDEARDVSCKEQFMKVIEQIQNNEIATGRGLNQEITLQRAGDARWGSHYGVIINLLALFTSVVELLEVIEKEGRLSDQRAEASDILDVIQCFEFVFLLHPMKIVLGITNELSQALQRKDQDLVNAMDIVKSCKRRFQYTRDNSWGSLLEETCSFCAKNSIDIPKMEDVFVVRGRSRRGVQELTNLHHFKNSLFYTVINDQMGELNSRFNEVNTELFLCMACLNPSNSFSAFDKKKLTRFAEFYPSEFSMQQLLLLDNQLENYIMDVKSHPKFSEMKGISDLAQKMV